MLACLQDIVKNDGRSLQRNAKEHNIHKATVHVKKLKAIESGENESQNVGCPCI